MPTPCGTFYKGPTRPLLSIGKSIIKDSVNVARIHILFKNSYGVGALFLKLVLRIAFTFKGIAAHNLYFLTFCECVIEFKVFSQR